MRFLARWLVAGAVLAAGCGAPVAARGGASEAVYVAAADGTIARLDGAPGSPDGRPLGPPLPAGVVPRRLVAVPGGRLLALSLGGTSGRGDLVLLTRSGARWAPRRVGLPAGASATHLAGGAGPWAAATYDPARAGGPPAGPAACRLALVDLRSGAVARTHAVCRAGERQTALALQHTPAPIAYVGLVAPPASAEQRGPGGPPLAGPAGAARGQLLALQALTGALVAAVPLAGEPSLLAVAPAPGGAGQRVYAVEALPGQEGARPQPGETGVTAERWRLVGLDPNSLAPVSHAELPAPPLALTLAPDGAHAYVLAGIGSPLGGSVVLEVDLAGGGARPLATVPGPGLGGLAVRGERLYVPQPDAAVVWAIDRRRGTRLEAIPVGRAPIAIAAPARDRAESVRARPAAWCRHRSCRPW